MTGRGPLLGIVLPTRGVVLAGGTVAAADLVQDRAGIAAEQQGKDNDAQSTRAASDRQLAASATPSAATDGDSAWCRLRAFSERHAGVPLRRARICDANRYRHCRP